MKKTITILGALGVTLMAMACSSDDGGSGVPSGMTGSGGGSTTGTGSGGGSTTADPTTTGDTTGGEGEPLLDSENPSWVDGAANTKGIQGAFFVLEDGIKDGAPVSDGLTHTDLMPDTFEEATSLCVTGTVAAVTTADGGMCDAAMDGSCEWSALWGGGIGLNLNETGEMDGAASMMDVFNATAAGVTGFSFTISGNFDGTIRFKAKMQGSDDDFCTAVDFGENTVPLTDLAYNCWDASMAANMTLDLTQLTQIQWQLVSKQNTTYEGVELCIDSLSVY